MELQRFAAAMEEKVEAEDDERTITNDP
ncbi:hypothetical protein CCACVL1_29430 [Corchorus capsularis]|uniref:Uncharacterized protein n=1 Tax=Corchorus capsularis TaxID=210143 RepID=A0A1R3G1P4_COCAP|nr:hypothetical protein CCACVL1_29430 [Corchorus capsularis]